MSLYLRRLMKRHRLLNAQAGEGGEGGGGSAAPGGENGASGEADATGTNSGEAGEGGDASGDGHSKAKPTDAEAKLLKEVMTKKNALAEMQRQLKAFEGIDPSAARAALQAQQEAERVKLEAKGDYERVKEQMAAAHSSEKTALEAQLTETRNQVAAAQAQIAELTIGSAFAMSSFIKDELAPSFTPSKTRMIYGSHFEFVDGALVSFDKPAGAKDRTPLVGADGNNLNFDAALRKLIDADPDRDQLLRSKMKPGTGSKTAPNTGTPPSNAPVGKGTSRIAAALSAGGLSGANGPDLK